MQKAFGALLFGKILLPLQNKNAQWLKYHGMLEEC